MAYERLLRKVQEKRKWESKDNVDTSEEELGVEQMIKQLVHDRFKKENLKLKHAKKRRRVIGFIGIRDRIQFQVKVKGQEM